MSRSEGLGDAGQHEVVRRHLNGEAFGGQGVEGADDLNAATTQAMTDISRGQSRRAVEAASVTENAKDGLLGTGELG